VYSNGQAPTTRLNCGNAALYASANAIVASGWVMTATDPSTNPNLIYTSDGCSDETTPAKNLIPASSCGNSDDLCVTVTLPPLTTNIYTYGTGDAVNSNDSPPGPCDCVVTAASGCGSLPETTPISGGSCNAGLQNGNFETGTFAPWTECDQSGSSGSFYINGNGAPSPIEGNSIPVNGAGGNWIALTDQGGPGSHVFYQQFASSACSSVSFDFFACSYAPFYCCGLDYTVEPTQNYRVDILSSVGNPFDTTAEVVLQMNFPLADTNNAWVHETFDISSLPPGTYYLRFGECDNQLFFNVGVDNVVIS